MIKRKAVSIILLLGLFSGLFIHYQARAPKRKFCDYRVYYKAGRDILEGKNIYVRENEEITPFSIRRFLPYPWCHYPVLARRCRQAYFL
jgi:hypothetical protein